MCGGSAVSQPGTLQSRSPADATLIDVATRAPCAAEPQQPPAGAPPGRRTKDQCAVAQAYIGRPKTQKMPGGCRYLRWYQHSYKRLAIQPQLHGLYVERPVRRHLVGETQRLHTDPAQTHTVTDTQTHIRAPHLHVGHGTLRSCGHPNVFIQTRHNTRALKIRHTIQCRS